MLSQHSGPQMMFINSDKKVCWNMYFEKPPLIEFYVQKWNALKGAFSKNKTFFPHVYINILHIWIKKNLWFHLQKFDSFSHSHLFGFNLLLHQPDTFYIIGR